MAFVNLTPHPVSVFSADGKKLFELVSSGVARLSQRDELVGEKESVPLIRSSFGAIEGLPASQEGVLFVLSAMMLEAAKGMGRLDVVAPATGPSHGAVRDPQGRIVGVTKFLVP